MTTTGAAVCWSIQAKRRARWLAGAAMLLVLGACSATPWTTVTDGRTLAGVQPVVFGGDGDVRPSGQGLVFEPGSPLTGVAFTTVPALPGYELDLRATPLSEHDFFCGLTFPTAHGPLTLILGGWGGAVCGLSCLDGRDAQRNETRTLRHFPAGREVNVRIRVAPDRVDVAIDGEAFLGADLRGRTASVRSEVQLCAPFGYCTYLTAARLAGLRWRPLTAVSRQPSATDSPRASRRERASSSASACAAATAQSR